MQELGYNIHRISQNRKKEEYMEDYSFINVSQDKLETIKILKAEREAGLQIIIQHLLKLKNLIIQILKN